MATRDILNKNGDIIGSLTLPDSTTDAQWSAALSAYNTNPILPDVTPRQMRQALLIMGITDTEITDTINGLPSPENSIALIEWEYSTAFQRNNPFTLQVASILGWSSDQLDALWTLAASQ